MSPEFQWMLCFLVLILCDMYESVWVVFCLWFTVDLRYGRLSCCFLPVLVCGMIENDWFILGALSSWVYCYPVCVVFVVGVVKGSLCGFFLLVLVESFCGCSFYSFLRVDLTLCCLN